MILDREKIKSAMERKFYTNKDLAETIGISPTTVNKARNERDITPKTLKKICEALGCTAEELEKEQ